jgi:hypothetical protein
MQEYCIVNVRTINLSKQEFEFQNLDHGMQGHGFNAFGKIKFLEFSNWCLTLLELGSMYLYPLVNAWILYIVGISIE